MLQTTDGSFNMRMRTSALPLGEDEQTAESQQRASLVRHRCYIGGTNFCSAQKAAFALSDPVSAQLQLNRPLPKPFRSIKLFMCSVGLSKLRVKFRRCRHQIDPPPHNRHGHCPPPPCSSSSFSFEVSGRWSLPNQHQLQRRSFFL